MKMFMYAIFDRASGIYDRPFPSRSDAEASRAFSDIAVAADHPIGQHPDDYTLFEVGIWDDNAGELVGTSPRKVINGVEAVSSSQRVNGEAMAALNDEVSGNA